MYPHSKIDIGTIGSGKKKSTGMVDIAMLQTLSKTANIKDYIDSYEQVIIDECHHIPATSFDSVLSKLPVRYSFIKNLDADYRIYYHLTISA